MRFHWAEIVQVGFGNVYAQPHGADHHCETENLDGSVDSCHHVDALEWEVERYGSQGEQDYKDDRHNAGVSVALADEYLVAIVEECSLVDLGVCSCLWLKHRS